MFGQLTSDGEVLINSQKLSGIKLIFNWLYLTYFILKINNFILVKNPKLCGTDSKERNICLIIQQNGIFCSGGLDTCKRNICFNGVYNFGLGGILVSTFGCVNVDNTNSILS